MNRELNGNWKCIPDCCLFRRQSWVELVVYSLSLGKAESLLGESFGIEPIMHELRKSLKEEKVQSSVLEFMI